MTDVTNLLSRVENGDPQAASELFPLVYGELRRLANWQMSAEKTGQTLQPTALVHEVYLKLVGRQSNNHYSGRRGFFCAASQAMRHILVDVARQKMAEKRGGAYSRQDVELNAIQVDKPNELLAVHDALEALKQHDSQAAEVVVMHYFAGFSLAEVAEVMGLSRATINRKWTYAKVWLRASMDETAE